MRSFQYLSMDFNGEYERKSSVGNFTRKPSFAPAWIYGVEVPIEQKKFH